MTVELDNIVKNLNGRELVIELLKEDEDSPVELYIGTDSSSGCVYPIYTVEDISETIHYYINSYLSSEDSDDDDDDED